MRLHTIPVTYSRKGTRVRKSETLDGFALENDLTQPSSVTAKRQKKSLQEQDELCTESMQTLNPSPKEDDQPSFENQGKNKIDRDLEAKGTWFISLLDFILIIVPCYSNALHTCATVSLASRQMLK